jgi:hypothetical protein
VERGGTRSLGSGGILAAFGWWALRVDFASDVIRHALDYGGLCRVPSGGTKD